MDSRENSPVSAASRDSGSSRSRSRSRSGSRSSSRERSRSSSPSPIRRIRGRDARSPRTEEDQQAVPPPLPAPAGRIPRRDAFVNAVNAVPPAPQLNANALRTRVALSEEQKRTFNIMAAGNEMLASERTALYKELPLPASVLALPPVLEDAMKSAMKDLRRSPESVVLGASDLHALHELILNILNISEVILKLGSDDVGAPFGPQVVEYLNILRRLVSAGIRDVTLWEREAVLRSIGVSRSRLPAIGAAPVEDASIVHRFSNELRPPLFGTELRTELTSSENSLTKGIGNVVKAARSSSSSGAYKRRHNGSARDEGRSSSSNAKFPRPALSRNRCLQSELVGDLRLRISAVRLNPPHLKESDRRAGRPYPCDSFVEEPSLVPTSSRSVPGGASRLVPENFQSGLSRRSSTPVVPAEVLLPPSMENLRRRWKYEGFSDESASILLAGWAANTRSQYDSALKGWFEYVSKHNIEVVPSVVSLINFLSFLKETGRSFSTMASYKSAICTFFSLYAHIRLSEDARLVQFMKGLFRERPSRARYQATWDVDLVLQFIRQLGINGSLSLPTLTRKCAFLLAICSPRRVSELAALSLDSLQRSSNQWIFFLEYRNKTRKCGPPQQVVYSSYYVDPLICPVRTLADYLKASENLRGTQNCVLISYVTGKPVTGASVARWIRSLLKEAGIDSGFGAHSTRGASASKALANGAPLTEVLKAGSWSAKSDTFIRFYHRELVEDSPAQFQNAVLNARTDNRRNNNNNSGSRNRNDSQARNNFSRQKKSQRGLENGFSGGGGNKKNGKNR